MQSIKSDPNKLSDEIVRDYQTKSVNDLWNKFKTSLKDSIRRHIPQKQIGIRRDNTWMTKEIKRKINRVSGHAKPNSCKQKNISLSRSIKNNKSI